MWFLARTCSLNLRKMSSILHLDETIKQTTSLIGPSNTIYFGLANYVGEREREKKKTWIWFIKHTCMLHEIQTEDLSLNITVHYPVKLNLNLGEKNIVLLKI